MSKFEGLKRAELQSLCKAAGLKANGKNADMIQLLIAHEEATQQQQQQQQTETQEVVVSVQAVESEPEVGTPTHAVEPVNTEVPVPPASAASAGRRRSERRSARLQEIQQQLALESRTPVAAAAPVTPKAVTPAVSTAPASANKDDDRRQKLIKQKQQQRQKELKKINKTRTVVRMHAADKCAGDNRPRIDFRKKHQEQFDRQFDKTVERVKRKNVTVAVPFAFSTPARAERKSTAPATAPVTGVTPKTLFTASKENRPFKPYTGKLPPPDLAYSSFPKQKQTTVRKTLASGLTGKKAKAVATQKSTAECGIKDVTNEVAAPSIPPQPAHAHLYKQTTFVSRALARDKKQKVARNERSKLVAANRA